MNDLVTSNLHLARQCAKKWRKYDNKIDYDDYYQVACIGLIKAAKCWNPNGTAKFSSYAYIRMDGDIKAMRSIHYTGYKEGFSRNYPVPTWVYDSESETGKDSNSVVEQFGHYSHDFVLRDEIRFMDIALDTMSDSEIEEQINIRDFISETKTRMKKLGVSITSLSQELGVSQPTASRWLLNSTRLTEERKVLITEALNNIA